MYRLLYRMVLRRVPAEAAHLAAFALIRVFGSVARENALYLMAWTQHQPASPRVDELATELFSRRSNGHWSTTQANAWSVLAAVPERDLVFIPT